MGGSKLPDLQVLRPKGTSGTKQPETHKEDNKWRQERQGEKRVWDRTPDKGRPDKRRRETSPEPNSGSPEWMEPPTFLTNEERKAREESREGDKQESSQDLKPQVQSPEVPQDPDPEPKGSSKTLVRTSVRTRIQEINKKSASPGKFPELKQTRMMEYLKKKSPKALKARQRLEEESEARPKILQGALKSPLSGDTNHPGPENKPSEGPGPAPVVRGGSGKVGEGRRP